MRKIQNVTGYPFPRELGDWHSCYPKNTHGCTAMTGSGWSNTHRRRCTRNGLICVWTGRHWIVAWRPNFVRLRGKSLGRFRRNALPRLLWSASWGGHAGCQNARQNCLKVSACLARSRRLLMRFVCVALLGLSRNWIARRCRRGHGVCAA